MTEATTKQPIMISVIDKDSFVLRRIPAAVGMKTRNGVITRMTPNGFYTTNKGCETLHRCYDGRLPAIYKSYVPKGL